LQQTEWRWNLEPMGSVSTEIELSCSEQSAARDEWIVIRGRGLGQPESVVALRVIIKD
jgi:hypothetical protein